MDLKTNYAQTKHNVTKKTGRSIEYIVVHYTGGTGTGEENCKYFSSGDKQASADYFIDKDGTIWQFNRDISNYYTWHCGDGKGKNGITNANSIGIECISNGEEFARDQKDALRALVKTLKKTYDIDNDHVVRHYDASGKQCPAPYSGSETKDEKWYDLWKYITGDWAKNKKGWWYVNGDGTFPCKDWIYVNGKWYYAKVNGYIAINEWATVSGKRYHFDSTGAMEHDCWIKTYAYCKSNGAAAISESVNVNGMVRSFDSWGLWIQ